MNENHDRGGYCFPQSAMRVKVSILAIIRPERWWKAIPQERDRWGWIYECSPVCTWSIHAFVDIIHTHTGKNNKLGFKNTYRASNKHGQVNNTGNGYLANPKRGREFRFVSRTLRKGSNDSNELSPDHSRSLFTPPLDSRFLDLSLFLPNFFLYLLPFHEHVQRKGSLKCFAHFGIVDSLSRSSIFLPDFHFRSRKNTWKEENFFLSLT